MNDIARRLIQPNLIPHWKENVTSEDYHTDTNSVSSSSLKKIEKSELSFFVHHYKMVEKEETKAQLIGKLVHSAILEWEKFANTYQVMPEFVGETLKGEVSKNSKAAKEKRAEWIAQTMADNPDAIICTQQERDEILGIMYSIANHKDANALLADGIPEMSGYYADPETGISLRIRPDFISKDQTIILDLKTAKSCVDYQFSKQMFEEGYVTSQAMYGHGAEVINQKKVDYYVFIVVEKVKPFEVAVYPIDSGTMEYAQQKYRRLLGKLKTAIDRGGDFLPYQTSMKPISNPHYAWSIEP